MVSMHLNSSLRMCLTTSTSIFITVLIMWLSYISLMSTPAKSLLNQVCCYRLKCCRFHDLLIVLCGLSDKCSVGPIHSNIVTTVLFIRLSFFFFIVQHSAPYVIIGFITVLEMLSENCVCVKRRKYIHPRRRVSPYLFSQQMTLISIYCIVMCFVHAIVNSYAHTGWKTLMCAILGLLFAALMSLYPSNVSYHIVYLGHESLEATHID